MTADRPGPPTVSEPAGVSGGRSGGSRARRAIAVTVLATAAAAAVALYAAGSVWDPGAGGLGGAGAGPAGVAPPGARGGQVTGTGIAPWLPAAALVALAGAGALVAVRGAARRILGGLLAVCGGGVVAAGVVALAGTASPRWPAVCVCAGTVIVAAGAHTVRRGGAWPSMGGRFERGSHGARGGPGAAREADLWDAIDRGDDPTR